MVKVSAPMDLKVIKAHRLNATWQGDAHLHIHADRDPISINILFLLITRFVHNRLWLIVIICNQFRIYFHLIYLDDIFVDAKFVSCFSKCRCDIIFDLALIWSIWEHFKLGRDSCEPLSGLINLTHRFVYVKQFKSYGPIACLVVCFSFFINQLIGPIGFFSFAINRSHIANSNVCITTIKICFYNKFFSLNLYHLVLSFVYTFHLNVIQQIYFKYKVRFYSDNTEQTNMFVINLCL